MPHRSDNPYTPGTWQYAAYEIAPSAEPLFAPAQSFIDLGQNMTQSALVRGPNPSQFALPFFLGAQRTMGDINRFFDPGRQALHGLIGGRPPRGPNVRPSIAPVVPLPPKTRRKVSQGEGKPGIAFPRPPAKLPKPPKARPPKPPKPPRPRSQAI